MSNQELHKLVDDVEKIMAGETVDDYVFDPADLGIEITDLDQTGHDPE